VSVSVTVTDCDCDCDCVCVRAYARACMFVCVLACVTLLGADSPFMDVYIQV